MTQTKIDWCIKKALKEGKKHKGLRKVEPNLKKVKEHIEKATRNLTLITKLKEIDYDDWAVSAIFYSMYHCLLAILWKEGFESRNQSCTFAVIEDLIESKRLDITIEEIRSIEDESDNDSVIEMREYYQYGTETEVNQEKFDQLHQKAKVFVTKIKILLE